MQDSTGKSRTGRKVQWRIIVADLLCVPVATRLNRNDQALVVRPEL